jgi:hypothetical protein
MRSYIDEAKNTISKLESSATPPAMSTTTTSSTTIASTLQQEELREESLVNYSDIAPLTAKEKKRAKSKRKLLEKIASTTQTSPSKKSKGTLRQHTVCRVTEYPQLLHHHHNNSNNSNTIELYKNLNMIVS